MNYAKVKKTDVANGPGIRVSLFVSGCTHHCEGCFNPETWDFRYGQLYTADTEREILDALKPDYIRGLSLLGGEPWELPNRLEVLELVKKVREAYPDKDIWCYTGYDYEKDLLRWIDEGHGEVDELLKRIDVLVDGPFEEKQKSLRLPFRGSENQRLIDVPVSLREKRVIVKEM